MFQEANKFIALHTTRYYFSLPVILSLSIPSFLRNIFNLSFLFHPSFFLLSILHSSFSPILLSSFFSFLLFRFPFFSPFSSFKRSKLPAKLLRDFTHFFHLCLQLLNVFGIPSKNFCNDCTIMLRRWNEFDIIQLLELLELNQTKIT